MDVNVQAQIARLESDVQHIRTRISEIKDDLRRVTDKIDATNARIDRMRDGSHDRLKFCAFS